MVRFVLERSGNAIGGAVRYGSDRLGMAVLGRASYAIEMLGVAMCGMMRSVLASILGLVQGLEAARS